MIRLGVLRHKGVAALNLLPTIGINYLSIDAAQI